MHVDIVICALTFQGNWSASLSIITNAELQLVITFKFKKYICIRVIDARITASLGT